MTAIERDRIAKKIIDGIMNDLENNSDLMMEYGDYWDNDNPDDMKETKQRWLLIAKRFIPVGKKTTI
jgi:hypothetical protein